MINWEEDIKCKFCNSKIERIPFKCGYCNQTFCSEHRLPEKHNCETLKIINKQDSQTYYSEKFAEKEIKREKKKKLSWRLWNPTKKK